MKQGKKPAQPGTLLLLTVLLNIMVMSKGFTANQHWYWWLCITAPLLLLAIHNYMARRKGKTGSQNNKNMEYENKRFEHYN
jgi:hypothetical protein